MYQGVDEGGCGYGCGMQMLVWICVRRVETKD